MALSANASIPRRNTSGMGRMAPVINTGVKVYQGALLVIAADGTAVIPANATTTTFVGIATAEVASGDGTLTAECVTDCEIQITLATAITVGNVGDLVYAVDDASVTALATIGPPVGQLVEFTAANSGWVRLGASALGTAS